MELTFDPSTKLKLRDLLYAYLYEPVQQKYLTNLRSIILRNANMQNSVHDSFVYKGVTYAYTDTTKLPRRMLKLIPQLQPEMNIYLREVKELNDVEVPFVLSFINQTLNASTSLQDYLRVLPPAIHAPLEELVKQCDCRSAKLSSERVVELQSKNAAAIEFMKQRLVLNLIS